MKQLLAPFFHPSILQNAHYCFDWGATQNFTIQQPTLGNGRANAIALVDTIVFAGRILRYDDGTSYNVDEIGMGSVYLWAHELTHLEQYRNLGVEEFSRWLIRDYNGLLEHPAQANGQRVANLLRQEIQRHKSLTTRAQRSRCQPGSGAIFSVQHSGGSYFLFGDCQMNAYRYFPQYDKREDKPSGRIVQAGNGFAAVDDRGNTYFARLQRYR